MIHGTTYGGLHLTEFDLDFLVSQTSSEASNKERLKELIQQEQDFREAIVGDKRVFQRALSDEEVFIKISPALYFEILLRNAAKELTASTHTIERIGNQNIPVFDTNSIVNLLSRSQVLEYLAHMLASFTRINSYVRRIRMRQGIWHRIRYNDMDIDSLIRLSEDADPEHRLSFYKRIADLCLFLSSIFQEHTYYGAKRRRSEYLSVRQMKRTMEDYEKQGVLFYGLAQTHPEAGVAGLTDVFGVLRDHFTQARKPLSFIANQYLHSSKASMFGFAPF